jgi:alanyl-tRNA synthetase
MTTGNQVREAFLRFFAARGHQVLPSSALVPEDPTTLFTTAGMQQFVPWFRREVEPSYGSVATVQKCVRTDDLDEVGRKARYHTFFEMLGNFSFGDYFKAETLRWGWELSTLPVDQGGFGLNAEHIWVTYYRPLPGEPYEEDLEARDLWKAIGVPAERIIPLGKKENWWGPVGDSGPCGPCSEMHYDRGAHLACGPDCTSPACGCDRWLEFWNHVFQQFNYQDGQYLPLPTPGIDTGAGLERIVSLVQDVETNYDTDLVSPLMARAQLLAGIDAPDEVQTLALKVIADHLRCVAFCIADGVLPGNNGRNYVIRRILRRAFRYGRALGLHQPFLHTLVPTLVDMMGGHYAELVDNAAFITSTVRSEEERFAATLERGEAMLAELIAAAQTAGATRLHGEDVFTLYDTYGFPKELTEESASEAGLGIDEAGFRQAMDAARQVARGSGKFAYEAGASLGGEIPATAFLGYTCVEAEATLQHFEASEDRRTGLVVLARTPFYAASGGQSADSGVLRFGETCLPVLDVVKDKFGHVLHTVDLSEHEEFTPGPHHTVVAQVRGERRDAIRRAHTATHLLHWALQRVLGEHAKQAGSLVEPDALRFDFSHPQAMTPDELSRVQALVYGRVLEDAPVDTRELSLDDARAAGYTALFGEKYGASVRAVQIGEDGFSRELCGGTHLDRTGQVGYFVVTVETSVAAGIRRIEALTGLRAAAWAAEQAGIVRDLSSMLRTAPDNLTARIETLGRDLRDAERLIGELKIKAAAGGGADGPQPEQLGAVKAIIAELQGIDAGTLAGLADQYADKLGSGVVVLAAASEGKVVFAVKVTKDLTPGLHAGNLVRDIAKVAGGGGGGRPDFAQAGGKDAGKIGEALAKARELIGG